MAKSPLDFNYPARRKTRHFSRRPLAQFHYIPLGKACVDLPQHANNYSTGSKNDKSTFQNVI
ncbi:hypothetical protein [Dechloromonas sp. HYN0024]|jgi:hypothetical protein|uniref:hypothetical protein n=1 Tax=Dechloromonas sp. HYN0024 TaxID=2231055 RepID=UPI001967DC30|nr:hypothetical protein [Dechloromonas sp. HYN0024]